MKSQILYHKSKHNTMYQWQVWTENDVVISETGQVGGKLVQSRVVCTPKNIGRANATTAAQQAELEAKAMFEHKLTRKYSLTPEKAVEDKFEPMLAKKFEDRIGKNIKYPLDIQRKYNGVRALCVVDENGKVELYTRGSRTWDTVGHINEELSKVLKPGDVLDGELFIKETEENGITFQTLMSLVKRKQQGTENLEYYVYDMPSKNGNDLLIWEERRKNLEQFFIDNPNLNKIKLAETYTVNSEAEVYQLHNEFVADGFEGAMARLHGSKYIFGYRSDELLKIKSFSDGEYIVVRVQGGRGKFSECAIFTLMTPHGGEFNAVPKVSQSVKEEMLRNGHKYVGKYATVKFFSLTDDNIPLFPVLLGFRPEQDLVKN